MSKPNPSMTNRTLSGLFWTALATGANVVSLLLVLFVLARLLTPADFGLAAAALMVIGFSAIFSDFGVGPAVVQRSDLRVPHVSTAFTFSVLLGILLGALTYGAAPEMAAFFQLDELTPILRLLAIIFPVQGFGVVADSLLQRELRFRTLAKVDVITFIVGYGIVGIALAVLGFKAWALVGAHLAQASLRTVLLICIRPHPIWPLLEGRACVDLLTFGGGFTAGRFSNYLAGQAEHLVIGRWLGPIALGIYGRAYQLMAGPAVLFGNVLDRVLFPTMVHVQHQPKRLAIAYRRGVALIALVILPLSVVVVCLAPEVVHLLLGPDWDAVIVPLQILGVGMLFRTSCKISDALVRATGAVYRRSWRQTAYALLVLFGAWVGQHWGVEGVAVAVLATLVLNFLLMAHLALRLAHLPWYTFAAAHLPGLALAALVGLPVIAVAEGLRRLGAGTLTVLILATSAGLPSLFAIAVRPRLFLGRDGLWMVRKLMGVLAARRRTDHAKEITVEPTAGQPIVRLAERLAAAGVRYARWKSRTDVQRVLSGAGDLDLLVDRKHVDAFLGLAQEIGFQQVVPCFESSATEETHLYGLDPATGVLLHVHANFTLLGTQNNLSPSLEEVALRNCAARDASGLLATMPVVTPAVELLVFVLRTLEQYARLGQAPRLVLTRDRLQAKLQTLLTTDAIQGLPALLDGWLSTAAQTRCADCLAALQKPTSWLTRFRLARRWQRSLGCGFSFAPRLPVSVSALWWRLRHRRGNPKQLPGGGMVIAFVGPDASGKSTMVAESARWLGDVFNVESAHLGKPPSTWLTWLPNCAGRMLGKIAPRLRTFHQRPVQAGTSGRGQGLLYRLRAVLLAWDRRALALRLSRQAERGGMIVCDRYPTACVGAPDSARLRSPDAEPGISWLHAFLARLENRLYRDIPSPNIVLRLSAPLALTINRNRERDKPGKEGDDFVERRHNDFFMPPFGAARIITLDTATSRDASIASARRQLWDCLCWPERFDAPPLQAAPMLQLANGTEPSAKKKNPLIVEFIGASGVGKSTLIRAVVQSLSAQGLRVGLAEDVILSRFGVAFPHHPKVGSAFLLALSLRPFGNYFFTRQGADLSRLAFHSIAQGMNNLWVGAHLVRNFIKRIGGHFLLQDLRTQARDFDIVIWDEGIVHAAHNLFVHNGTVPEPDKIEAFARMVPKPDLLVWVTAPTAQSAQVLLERGHSRVPATTGAADTFAEHAQTTFEVLAAVPELKERIYQIDNSALADEKHANAIHARAAAIGAHLIRHMEQAQEPQARKGASLCLTA